MNNLCLNNNESRYSQLSAGRTYLVCKQLSETTINIQVLISRMGRTLPRKNVQLCKNSEPKLKSLTDQYTHQNIENGTAQYMQTIKIFRQRDLNNADRLYNLTLKAAQEYVYGNRNMNDLDQFCFFFFLGGVFSHVPGFEIRSFESYAVAISLAEKLHDFDLDTIIQGKLVKHQALPVSPKLVQDEGPVTLVNALCSKIFFEKGISSPNNLPELFTGVQYAKFSKLVLKLNALDALYHSRFKILFVRQMAKATTFGSYNSRNTIRIVFRTNYANRLTLLHELTHKAMAQVFYNLSLPYYKGDGKAKSAYRESMRQVLLNLIDFADLTNKASDLPLNELVEFCFGEESLENALEKINDPFILKLFNKLHNVFGGVYLVSSLDSEFITNTLQYLNELDIDSPYFRCIQPLLNYIDEFVVPEMEKYINQHPCKDRVKD